MTNRTSEEQIAGSIPTPQGLQSPLLSLLSKGGGTIRRDHSEATLRH